MYIVHLCGVCVCICVGMCLYTCYSPGSVSLVELLTVTPLKLVKKARNLQTAPSFPRKKLPLKSLTL